MIYIIEDNTLKAKKIINFLEEEILYPKEIRAFASFQSGLRAVEAACPSLVILDMTLPTFDRKPNSREGRSRPLGGYDLMRKMKLKSLSSPVIVLTQLEAFGEDEAEVSFEEITNRCHREFPDIFIGSVYFDQSETTWKTSLKQLIEKVIGNNEC